MEIPTSTILHCLCAYTLMDPSERIANPACLMHRAEEDGVSTLTADAQRFAARVNVTPTCHYWTGATDRDGYGSFNADGKKYRAHVYAYIQAHGEIPAGLELDHLCHRRNCVNPAHLEPKTHVDNLAQRSDRLNATPANVLMQDGSISVDTVKAKPRGRPFEKGWRGGPGRPKRGESVPELLKRQIERPRVSQAVVAATVERMLRTDSVGNRAFADATDRVYGTNKQTFVMEQGDSPLAALLERLANRTTVVEGEARVLDITPAVDALSDT